MVISQADAHQGRERVDLRAPAERTTKALAARFELFADVECSGESGLGVFSPAYALLSRAVARDAGLLALAAECRRGQPVPNLFFAAVKRVAETATPRAELALLYARIADGEPPPPSLPAAFARFCAEHAAAITALARTRRVQTNEIRRCAYLMPAFGTVSSDAGGRALAMIDVGASAGLNLLWDEYRYAYSDGSEYGPRDSAVTIESELRSPMPPLPSAFPEVAFRAGVDLSPVDLSDDAAFGWMRALVWPDHADRAALLSAAREIWLANPPTVEAGDAVETLPRLLAAAPPDAALCVFHCHALNQFPPAARNEFYGILRRESERRTIYHIPSEGERMSVDKIIGGRAETLLSARRSAHGRWIEWDF